MLRALIIIFLFVFSFNSYATDLQVRNGKLSYPLTKEFNENGFRAWKVIGGGIEQEYQARFDKSLHVRDVSTGFRSTSTVPVTFQAKVSRKAVISGAFGLVKRGAALGTRLSGWGTAAYLAYEAYEAVKGDLEKEGFKWNEVNEEFLKEWPARNCLVNRDNEGRLIKVACYGVDSSVLSAYRKGGQSRIDAEQLMKGKMEKLAGPFWDQEKISLDIQRGEKRWEYFTLDVCRFDLNGGDCLVKSGSDYRSTISFQLYMRDTEVLGPEKFLQLATESIDLNPNPFIKGTGYPEYNEKVSVPAGTVVTIGPVTPENGKPVQITITFGKDSNGNTTAEVATTQRPDLDPGSPEAPNKKPDGNPDSNPDGKPDKKPDGNPDGKPDKKPDDNPDGNPDKKPDPDEDPSNKDKDQRKEDKKNDKKEESKGLLCDFFPNILACDKMGKPQEGMFDDIKIPQVTDEKTWDSDNFLPPNGVCPQPKSFNIWGRPVQISYEPLCVFMEKVRFAVLLGFIIMSAFIVFGSLRKG